MFGSSSLVAVIGARETRELPRRGGAPHLAAIGDHALVGDGRSAALVARDATIDWLCWPRFDSGAALFALLDPEGGAWRLRFGPPSSGAPARGARRYVDGTNVLVTELAFEGGRVRVTDLMPAMSEAEKRDLLTPEHELLRVIECTEGSCALESVLCLRPGFGGERPRLRRRGADRACFEVPGGVWSIAASVPLASLQGDTVVHRARLSRGERAELSLTFAEDGPLVLVPFGARTDRVMERTIAWWRAWSSRMRYDGPHREAVVRSVLVLKALTYAPSGAIVAAPTTSLPEREGGDLNWDYRFCWLRDASLTVSSLLDLGYPEDARAFVSWLLHSTRLTRPELRVLYDVYGRVPDRERVLELAGWRGSTPVRVGNAAAAQLQLDVYGEVVDSVAQLVRRTDLHLDGETRRMLLDFGRFVCEHWRRPDSGIWEGRGRLREHTHSRVLSWVALDRLVQLSRRGLLPEAPVDELAAQREAIRADVEARGFDRALGSYVQTFGGRTADASLLQLAWYGYRAADHARMRGTYELVARTLGVPQSALVHRNEQSLVGGEGAFGITSFWAVDYLARGGGTLREAERRFRELLGYANDVGLFAEEIDPRSGEAIGNFPQAFTHVGLIDAALSLERRRRARDAREAARPEVRA